MFLRTCPECGGPVKREGNHYLCLNCLKRITEEDLSIQVVKEKPMKVEGETEESNEVR